MEKKKINTVILVVFVMKNQTQNVMVPPMCLVLYSWSVDNKLHFTYLINSDFMSKNYKTSPFTLKNY